MRCFLDLDNVIADFYGHWYVTHPEYQRPNPWPVGQYHIEEIHKLDWADSCRGLDLKFWQDIPWMPDGHEILWRLEDFFGQKNICILSSNKVTEAGIAAHGKVSWIEHHLPRYRHQYFLGASKGFLAHRGVTLIDDLETNVDDFMEHGGLGFLLPRPQNRKHAIPTLQELNAFLKSLSQ